MIVTSTGMKTEIGHIADLLANTENEKTPLQKQLDGLSKIIATIAGIALILVVAIGLVRGDRSTTCSSRASRWPSPRSRPDSPPS